MTRLFDLLSRVSMNVSLVAVFLFVTSMPGCGGGTVSGRCCKNGRGGATTCPVAGPGGMTAGRGCDGAEPACRCVDNPRAGNCFCYKGA